MKYIELDERIKDKLRDGYREQGFDYEWWEFVYEDATRLGAMMGITVERISFTGFYTQGSDASYSGHFGQIETPGAVKQEAPQDEELHRIEAGLVALQVAEKLRTGSYLESEISDRGRYHTMQFDTSVSNDFEHDNCYNDEWPEIESKLEKLLSDFSTWIFKQLQAEYDHMTSDETIDDYFIDLENDYDEDGVVIGSCAKPSSVLESNSDLTSTATT